MVPLRFTLVIILFTLPFLSFSSQDAFGQQGASIRPPVGEEVVDADRNGLYEELRLRVTLHVQSNATYRLFTSLYASVGRGSVMSSLEVVLDPGLTELVVAFPGDVLRRLNDGPYRLVIFLFRTQPEWALLDEYEGETASYMADAFELPFISFRPPFSERGIDSDANGLWDQLVIDIALEVRQRISVRLYGQIRMSSAFPGPTDLHSTSIQVRDLEPGEIVLDLVFPGPGFQSFERDGPYEVVVRIQSEGGPSRFYGTTHRTDVYRAVEFEPTTAEFASGTPEVRFLDADGNGKTDFAELELPIVIREEGNYLLRADSVDPCVGFCPWLRVSKRMHLEPGTRTVTLNVSGVSLARSPSDGPWVIRFMVARLDGVTSVDFRLREWVTPAFNRSNFEAPPPVRLEVVLQTADGLPLFGFFTALDPERRFRLQHGSTSTYPPRYSMSLYQGNFTLLVTGSHAVSRDPGRFHGEFSLNLTEDIERELVLQPLAPDREEYEVTVEARNSATVSVSRTSHAPRLRSEADFDGNFDGFANETELALLAPSFPSLWSLEVELDKAHLYETRTGYDVLSGSGDYMHHAPLITSEAFVLHTSELTPSAAPGHVALRMFHDTDRVNYSAELHLPSHAESALLRSSSSVIVRGQATSVWQVDPGLPSSVAEGHARLPAVVEFGLDVSLNPIQRTVIAGVGIIAAAIAAYVTTLSANRRRVDGRTR